MSPFPILVPKLELGHEVTPIAREKRIAIGPPRGTLRGAMKTFLSLLIAAALTPLALFAKDTKDTKEKAPSGFIPIEELTKAQEKAKAGKKLIAVLAKGEDDACPHCAAAMSAGQSAFKGDCVLVFTRSESISTKTLPEVVKNGLAGSPTGAAVTFVIFNAELTEVVGKIGRDALESDKKAVSAMKKTVDEAKKKAYATAK